MGSREPTKPPTVTRAALAHWVAAPAAWRGFSTYQARARSVVRRASDARHALQQPTPSARAGVDAIGFLFAAGAPGRVPLFSAFHPATNDQLLTVFRLEAQDMGYTGITELGWLSDRAPVTGRRELQRLTVPWASRYGLEARRQ